MAGERLANQTIFITAGTLTDGAWVNVWLAGQYRQFTAALADGRSGVPLNLPGRFNILTASNAAQDQLQRLTVESFIFVLQQFLLSNGLDTHYAVTPVTVSYVAGQVETTACLIQATSYEPAYDFQLPTSSLTYIAPGTGYSWYPQLSNTIRPVQVAVTTTPTGAFGTASGGIVLVASNGTVGTYTYLWADAGAPFAPVRTGLAAGSYTCIVTDASGASTTVVVVVSSDVRLDVLINRTANNVTLVPSGGVAPYAYAWADGPTTATRLALAQGTYTCTVSDARGATRVVRVVVDPYRFYWSKNPVTLALDAGADYRLNPASKPNLSFVCEVWVEEQYRSGTFVLVGGTQEQPADRFGRTVFDAQALLDSYLGEDLPALNQDYAGRADSLFRRFYFRYAEKYGTPPLAAALSNQAEHYVVLGGLDFYEAPADTWFSSYQAGAKPFLTWEPAEKAVLADQPEYLYFMVDSFALTDFELVVDVQYADGTRGQLRRWATSQARRFEVYCLPVGFLALGLGASGPAVSSWQVWVSDAGGQAQTERRRYVLNTDYVARPRYFLYTNSLGGTSTLCCTGDAKAALDLKAEEADRPLGAGYDPLLGDTLPLDRSGVPTLSVSSGKLRRGQLVALQDFLLSKRVTLQAGNAYFPGRVKAKAIPLVDEGPGELSNLEFDFLLPRQRQFSPRLPATAAGRDVVPVRGGEGAQP